MIALWLLGCGVEPAAPVPVVTHATARTVVRSTWSDAARTYDRAWVGFRASLEGLSVDCQVDWRAVLVDRHDSTLRSVSGQAFVPADQSVPVSGLVSMEPERAGSVAAVDAQVLDARCGDDLPEPHLGLVEAVVLTGGEEDGLPYLEVQVDTAHWGPPRCEFRLVTQALDVEGLPVRHDVRPVSLRPGLSRVVRVPVTTLHSGQLADTAPLVSSHRAWIEDLQCLPITEPVDDPVLPIGVRVWRVTDAAIPFEAAVWPTLDLRNPLDRDCAYVVGVDAVDWSGRSVGSSVWTVHLPAGTEHVWSPSTPIGVWEEAIEDIAVLRVSRTEARCDAYRAERALTEPASSAPDE